MSDFPRGWTLVDFSSGGTATITVPAIPGVVHVLDAFTATLTNIGAAAEGLAQIVLSSSDGAFAGFSLGVIAFPSTAPGTTDTASGSGLDLAAGPGASLTIAFNAAGPDFSEQLLIQGHDI